jgi:transposase
MSQNNQVIVYAGVDVAKRSLQLDWNGQSYELPNDAKGFARMRKLLGPPGRCQVIMEATGGYERALRWSLQEAGYAVSVMLPAKIRAFAYADGQWAKTDPVDARVCQQFGEKLQPPPSPRMTAAQRRLQELVSRRSQLVEARKVLANQTEHFLDAWIRRQLQRDLAHHDQQIAQCEAQITALLAADEVLTARVQRLQEVPGVGLITAVVLEAYVPELGSLSSATAAGITGLAPYAADSGPRKGLRFIRGGRKPARCALFMAAMSAIRHDAILKAFYQRLCARGKKPIVALTAVMRKLIVLLNRLLKDPAFQLQASAS